jgi:hypothetical protein
MNSSWMVKKLQDSEVKEVTDFLTKNVIWTAVTELDSLQRPTEVLRDEVWRRQRQWTATPTLTWTNYTVMCDVCL